MQCLWWRKGKRLRREQQEQQFTWGLSHTSGISQRESSECSLIRPYAIRSAEWKPSEISLRLAYRCGLEHLMFTLWLIPLVYATSDGSVGVDSIPFYIQISIFTKFRNVIWLFACIWPVSSLVWLVCGILMCDWGSFVKLKFFPSYLPFTSPTLCYANESEAPETTPKSINSLKGIHFSPSDIC